MTAKAWVVRGGRKGEHEQYNIDHGRTTVGWADVGDIGPCASKAEVLNLLEQTYPDYIPNRRSNISSQLWSFRNRIRVGDLIVMPLKTKSGYLQFGRVTGPYAYDAQNPDGNRRKYLPVTWNAEPVSKAGIESDLMYSLNAIMTVFSPSRHDAVNRLVAIAQTGADPGYPDEAADALQAPTPASHLAAVEEDDEEVTDPETVPTLGAIQDQIRAFIAENFREHKLTHLVADVLEVHGFLCEVSPPGPDGGVDIVAGMGPLGLDSPTLVVEVKSEPNPVDVKVLRGLHSARIQHEADQALLVAWGGVTKAAAREFRTYRTSLRIWDGEEFLNELLAVYDELTSTIRAELPLKQAWVLDEDALG